MKKTKLEDKQINACGHARCNGLCRVHDHDHGVHVHEHQHQQLLRFW